MLSEKLGNWHFWLTFIGMNLTFMPMHWSGLLRHAAPHLHVRRRPGLGDLQPDEHVRRVSSRSSAADRLRLQHLSEPGRSGAIAGNDPWGAPTLEWSIPSPPPEYNFATIPTVTSRYPLWDVQVAGAHARRAAHAATASERIDVDVARQARRAVSHRRTSAIRRQAA